MPIGVAGGIALAGTAASAGASAAGAAGQKSAASEAAGAQSAGIGKGIDALTRAYGGAQGYLNPYARLGNIANNRLPRCTVLLLEAGSAKGKYKRDLANIWAERPDTNFNVGLPDTSQYAIGGLDEKWDPSGIVGKYDPAAITANYAGLPGRYALDAQAALKRYDVSDLGDRVNVEQDPGYKFRRDQGILAQQRNASARGTLQGGGFAKDLEEYSQGLASQEYGNAYNRLLGENQLGFDRYMAENERGYGREVEGYGREMAGNELGFGREYGANELGYGRDLQTNEMGYGRTTSENDREYGRAEDLYGRQTDDYGRRMQMLGLQYEPLRGFAEQGRQTAGSTCRSRDKLRWKFSEPVQSTRRGSGRRHHRAGRGGRRSLRQPRRPWIFGFAIRWR